MNKEVVFSYAQQISMCLSPQTSTMQGQNIILCHAPFSALYLTVSSFIANPRADLPSKRQDEASSQRSDADSLMNALPFSSSQNQVATPSPLGYRP